MCELAVSDNGRGLPADFVGARDGNFGWRVVEAVANDLQGVLIIGRGPGATFRILFPCPHGKGHLPGSRAIDNIAI
jgi:two-component sensor histidine kinase